MSNGIALEFSGQREGERVRDSQRQAALATISRGFVGSILWRRGDRQRENEAKEIMARAVSEARGGSSLRDRGGGRGRVGQDRGSRNRGYEANTEERSRPTGSGGSANRGRGQGRGGPGRGRGRESNLRADRETVYRGESQSEESDSGEEDQFLNGAQRRMTCLVNEAAAFIEEESVRIRLLSDFNNGLHQVHRAWKGPLQEVTTELLSRQALAPDEKAELVYIMALLLLPDMVEYSRRSKGKGNIIKPGPFLAAVASSECPALYIINQAF
jgi:hypothetical protein